MPLLNGRKFTPAPPPSNLKLEERVFQNTTTGEIFRDYETFYKRSLLCKSLVWTCEYTGKSSLTYTEAVKMERDSAKQIASIPHVVKEVVLQLIHHCQRSSLWQLYEEVWGLIKDRYYEGEDVDVTISKKRLKGKIVAVLSPSCTLPRGAIGDGSLLLNGVDGSPPPHHPATPPFSPCLVDLTTDFETPPMPLAMATSPSPNNVAEGTPDGSDVKEAVAARGGGGVKQSPARKKTPKTPISPEALLDPSGYRYRVAVKEVEGVREMELPASDLTRVRNSMTREKLRLFIRFATCKRQNSDKFPLLVKESLVATYQLGDCPFLPGPIDATPLSKPRSPKKRKFSQCSIDNYFGKAEAKSPKKKRPSLPVEGKSPVRTPKKSSKKASTPTPHKSEKKWPKDVLKKMLKHKRMTPKKRERLHTELKKILEDEKEEKATVRKQAREEKQKAMEVEKERLREWCKPREDLACDDSLPLPPASPLPFKLAPELFPHAVMVMEYLRLFTPLFDINGPKPNAVSFAKLEESLLESDPDCTLYNIMRFLLLALFVTMEDEEEKEVSLGGTTKVAVGRASVGEEGRQGPELAEESPEQLADVFSGNVDGGTKDAVSTAVEPSDEPMDDQPPVQWEEGLSSATIYATWSLRHQGISLRGVELDYFTLSEVLRLHLLSSGHVRSSSACRQFRYQCRGGYSPCDDPGVEFCGREKAVLQKLSRQSVYDLAPADKISLVSVLCHQLLTYSVVRDALYESAAELKSARKQYRLLRFELDRLDNPGKKKRRRKEAAEGSAKDKENSTVEGEEGTPAEDPAKKKSKKKATSRRSSTAESQLQCAASGKGESLSPVADQKEREEDEGEAEGGRRREEVLEDMADAMKDIIRHSQATNLCPLGRDRWQRIYWWFPSMPGLYVERTAEGSPPRQQQQQTPPRPAPAVEGSEDVDPQPQPEPALWACYSADEESIGDLMAGLNARGAREGQLRESLAHYKPEMIAGTERLLGRRGPKLVPPEFDSAEDYMELSLRDHLLELEDNVYCGNLGYVRSEVSRAEWIRAVEQSVLGQKYQQRREAAKCRPATADRAKQEPPKPESEPAADQEAPVPFLQPDTSSPPSGGDSPPPGSPPVQPGGGSSSGVSTPFVNPQVRAAAALLSSIQEGIEVRFLKQPFGRGLEDAHQGSRRAKKTVAVAASETEQPLCPTADNWSLSLRMCTSFAQVFIHLATLDRAIIWSKSLQNIRCRKCRKKGGDEYLLLCDRCDNGYHTYCLDPPLVEIPTSDWFCSGCRPASPVKLRRVSSVRRRKAGHQGSEDAESEEEESGGEDTPGVRRRQANRKNIPLPRRSARIISKRRPSEESEDSEDSEPSGEEEEDEEEEEGEGEEEVEDNSTEEEEGDGDSPVVTLQVRTEAALADLRGLSAGTRAHRGKMNQLHECLLDELMEHKDAFFLEKLPKKAEAPEYYSVVKDPVDLHMLKVRALNEGYLRSSVFVEDVRKMFGNTFKYFKKASTEWHCGKSLEDYFNGRLAELGMVPPPPQRKAKVASGGKENKGSPAAAVVVDSATGGVAEEVRTRTCIAVAEMRDTPEGTRAHHARSRAVQERLVEELMQHRAAALVRLPSRKKCPGYFEVVREPVDLSQLRVRAKNEGFESLQQVQKEVQRLAQNTQLFFGPDSEEIRSAGELQLYLESRLRELGLLGRKKTAGKRRTA